MADLDSKIENGLNETRMLVMGAQVLVGFEFVAFFEKSFAQLPLSSQYLKMISLGLLLSALALLMAPAAYHRIVLEGQNSPGFHRYMSRLMKPALLPFGIGMAIDFYIASERVLNQSLALPLGLVMLSLPLVFWYGLEAIQPHHGSGTKPQSQPKARQAAPPPDKQEGDAKAPTPLSKRIKQVLIEARVVLPGAQALLGFQFNAILMEGFRQLPQSSKLLHLGSLGVIALTIVLLMTPAAWHRLVEHGEDSERFHGFASGFVLAAMVTLALGLCGDLFVVLRQVTHSLALAGACAGAMLLLAFGLWFGLALWCRHQDARRPGSRHPA